MQRYRHKKTEQRLAPTFVNLKSKYYEKPQCKGTNIIEICKFDKKKIMFSNMI